MRARSCGKSRTYTAHSCWKWGSSRGRGTRPSANQGQAQWFLRSRMRSRRSWSTPHSNRIPSLRGRSLRRSVRLPPDESEGVDGAVRLASSIGQMGVASELEAAPERTADGGLWMTSRSVDSHDALDLGVNAAEIGTWNWHIRSGRLDWTSWTYQLFGFQPGGIATSHELFLRRVHAPDRAVVLAWISRAMKERTRTSLEFRIDRADGTVRWIRSTGRVLADQHGDAERMIGVAEDVTDFHRAARAVRVVPLVPRGPMRGFSAREVAQMLGVAEVTVKRLAASGEIRMFRSSKKNTRRFAADHIVEYLG